WQAGDPTPDPPGGGVTGAGVHQVPEPSTAALLALGVAPLALCSRRVPPGFRPTGWGPGPPPPAPTRAPGGLGTPRPAAAAAPRRRPTKAFRLAQDLIETAVDDRLPLLAAFLNQLTQLLQLRLDAGQLDVAALLLGVELFGQGGAEQRFELLLVLLVLGPRIR